MSQSGILGFFPYPTMREVQRQLLLEVERVWDKTDVLVITAPTATGKSAIAKTILDWTESAVYLAPTNLLIKQFLGEFPATPALHRMDSYQCQHAVHRTCVSNRAQGMCRGCPAMVDLSHAKFRAGSVVMNYHTYVAQQVKRPVLVVDEAHNLIPFISSQSSTRHWKHRPPHYPRGDPASLRAWIAGLRAGQRKGKFISQLDAALNSEFPQWVVEEKIEEWRGGGQQDDLGETTKRGQIAELPCLRLTPTDIRDLPALRRVLPAGTKLVLLSATIGKKDIEQLGLDRRRVIYLNCQSPILPALRPVSFRPTASVSYANLADSTRSLGTYVEEHLLPHHRGEKGIVHCTYQQSEILRPHLTSGRFLFHSRDDKALVYQQFRDSAPAGGAVLVACGMHEGLDLPEDMGRWQAILKVPWKSLGDRAIQVKAERDPDWYSWETLKVLVQACGRICRTPEDYGVSYILDGSFMRLQNEASHLFPAWWLESLVD